MKRKLLMLPLFCFSLLIGCGNGVNTSQNSITNKYNDPLEYYEGYAFYIDGIEYHHSVDTKNGNLIISKGYGREIDKVFEIEYSDYKIVYSISAYNDYQKAHLYKYDYGYMLVVGK